MTRIDKSTQSTHGHTKTTTRKYQAFEHTMTQARSHMSTLPRVFSKTIHARPIEFISDVLGNSVFRPTAIIVGSLSAFIFSGVMYLIAKRYGYELAGSEFLVAFGFGWAAGIILDYIRLLISSVTKKSR